MICASALLERARARRIELERDQYRSLYLAAIEQIKKLELGLLGQKAERMTDDDKQLSLKILEGLLRERETTKPNETPAKEAEPEKKKTLPSERKRGGRKLPPECLPRVAIEIIPLEVQREGLDAYVRIGEETTEQIERRPASSVVVKVVKPKFKRKQPREAERAEEKTEILIADSPELPIPGGIAGPGMLADTIVRRWQDHLPLNRLEGIYAREGLDFAKSTICGWHEKLAELAEPIVEAMHKDALKQPYLCTDATGVLVQAPEKCRRGYFWVLVAPELHVLYKYSRSHDSKAVDRMLADYQGYLVADAHSVYDHLYEAEKILEAGCFAHARRYFFKSLESDPERARAALGMINALFRIERENESATRAQLEKIRQRKSRAIVERFFQWCDAEASKVLDDTPISKAIGYSRNQKKALCRFLDDGRLPLSNNISERNLRRQVIGRKNWMFVGNDDGGEVNAIFTSLLASCQLHGIEPWAYLRDVLCLLPGWKKHRALELAPAYWKKTLEDEKTQEILDANIYRRVSLGLDPVQQPAK